MKAIGKSESDEGLRRSVEERSKRSLENRNHFKELCIRNF